MKLDNKGFTLIELLAVMIILISISLVAVGGITESLQNRDIKECKEQQELAISAAKIYFSLNDTTSVTVGELNSSDPSKVDYFKDDKKKDRLKDTDVITIGADGYKYNGEDAGKSCEEN
jgi:prepilin-type N-terminal cleavage/methylation domain-containing protein